MLRVQKELFLILNLGLGCTFPLPALAAESTRYSKEELRTFEALRDSPFLTEKNFLIPKSRSTKDQIAFNQRIEELNQIRERIGKGTANEEEINRFFTFREKTLNYRLQLIHQLHAERGGTLSKNDPNLDLHEIKDPAVKAHYEEYLKAQKVNDRAHKEALQSIAAMPRN